MNRPLPFRVSLLARAMSAILTVSSLFIPSLFAVSMNLLDSSGSPPGNGALFGVVSVGNSVYYVDDATNTLNLLH